MWNPFRRRVTSSFGSQGAPGTFKNVWEEKELPGPGTGNFAYETLSLFNLTPIGPGVRAREQIRSIGKQLYVLQSAPVVGVPLVAGQIVGQPLYNPNGQVQT